jgi:hypothetical protein
MAASHWEPHTNLFFFMGWPKWMHMTSLLQSPPSILSKTNSNLWILRDFVFQLNSDFISNSNINPSGLLLHPYISLREPPPRIPMPISSQNQTLAATHVPPRRWCLLPLLHLFQSLPFKLNPMPVMRSQRPNHRKKNHIKTRSVASAIYRRSLIVVSHQGCNFSGELEVNPTLPVRSSFRNLAPGLYGSEIGGV